VAHLSGVDETDEAENLVNELGDPVLERKFMDDCTAVPKGREARYPRAQLVLSRCTNGRS
jgi:hypothetical protein